jgi:hypothetical protein
VVRRYAEKTSVPASRTREEIQTVLKRYGATSFGFADMAGTAMVAFELKGRRMRFKIPMPDEAKKAQDYRQRWRALLLAIKAKLEVAASGIESLEEAFMAQIVLPDGRTMGEVATPQIAHAYAKGEMPPLLGSDT